MRVRRPSAAALAAILLLAAALHAQDYPVPFRDPGRGAWGYRGPDGNIVIPPRFVGAGAFREDRAPVQDELGFAIIDTTGRVVARIATDSVSPSAEPVPPPAAACTWTGSATFPSTGLQCYIHQLRGEAPTLGGNIMIRPERGESSRAAIVLKLANGLVVVELIGYEGFTRRVLLPVSAEQARAWRRTLYPDMPPKEGCSETWSSGPLPGGAFIEQSAGC